MNGSTAEAAPTRPGPLDQLLGLFSDVLPGEGARALLMLVNVFLILVCYYIIKTVREPLILTASVPESLQGLGIGPAEVKTYAAAGQALVLMGFVPAYSWFASRVDRMKLTLGVTAFFVANILLFALAVQARVDHVGVFFYIWVGIFSLSIIAQFWSYANDIYTKEAGDRLFPVIGIGMTAGSPVGAWITGRMFESHLAPPAMLCLAAALLLVTAGIYALVNRGGGAARRAAAKAEAPLPGKSGFALVFASRYIGLIALVLVVYNCVNTVGEYILSNLVVAHAAEVARTDPAFDKSAWIGAFYGSYLLWTSVGSLLLQAFVASRLVRRFGVAGVLFALPAIALGGYGFVALGATLGIVRWAKTAENATDYSIMNTAKQLLWLPTTRAEKYKAKQAVDSFFVRLGDVAAASLVFAGTAWLTLGTRGFAVLNLVFVGLWLLVGVVLVRENRRLSSSAAA